MTVKVYHEIKKEIVMSPENTYQTIEVKMENRGGNKKSFVVPGHQRVRKNDVITWKMKNSSAVFFFPKTELFGESEYRVSEGETLSLTVSDNVENGQYPYAVFTDNNEFAKGGSYPKLIIAD